MKLTFIGAAHEVTGSATLLQINDRNILVDYGTEQGFNVYENISLPVKEEEIDIVLLTHAHIDHSGNIPLLYKNGFRGKIYATEESCKLCEIMLIDSATIHESEAEWKNKKAKRSGGKLVEPIYGCDDANGALNCFSPVKYCEIVEIGNGVKVRFTDMGHLLGSAAIEMWLKEDDFERKIVFSGDVGNINQPMINDPKPVFDADYVVIESTYGNRLHEVGDDKYDTVDYLAECIQSTLDLGGNIIIPSFAVGRTQEILYFIREIKEKNKVVGHDGFKVYVDSPMAIKATEVFMNCDESCLDADALKLVKNGINPLKFDGLSLAVTTEESKAINYDKEPKVIISSGGMCENGRIKHHLKHNLWRSDSTVLFVGYQSAGTLGRKIYDGAKEVDILGEKIAVNANIALLPSISAHADRNGLIHWLGKFEKKPRMVFVNHGDDDACEEFTCTLINECGYDAYAPFSGTVFDVAKNEFVYKPDGILTKQAKNTKEKDNEVEYHEFERSVEALVKMSKKCSTLPAKSLKKLIEAVNDIIKAIEK